MTTEEMLRRFWVCKSKLRCIQDIPWFVRVTKSNTVIYEKDVTTPAFLQMIQSILWGYYKYKLMLHLCT
jgi:hypothetical protein